MAITAPPAAPTVTLSIDGQELTVPEGTTIWDAAKTLGIKIPMLCHDERYDPVGVCRVCAVDVGARLICGLGQVALGPAISVLGLERGGTAARAQPRSPDETRGT